MSRSAGPLVSGTVQPGSESVRFEHAGIRTPGASGSFGFADPDARLSMGYVMNQVGGFLVDDPRETALRDAAYRAVAKLRPSH